MRPGARIAAAIEVLDEVLQRHQPVSLALQSWGKAHRFAGSGDRNAIGHMVYDGLRHKASSEAMLGSNSSRALVIGGLAAQGLAPDAIAAMCRSAEHGPQELTADETQALERGLASDAPAWIAGNYPEWLEASFKRAFGDRAAHEGQALSERAPADIRVNALKATREKVLKALSGFGATATDYVPTGVRVAAPKGDARTPNLQAEAAFQAGWCEIQDEGSQIAAALTGAGPRQQVLDLCAGAGGKSLAMAAVMQNTGQLYAYDADRIRLKPIHDRVRRAGVRNIQILRARDTAALEALGARFDVVLIDAPCTGAGTWRRRPDAKWRLKPEALASRISEQKAVLREGASLVKPGGRLVYVTCSVLPEENVDQVASFLAGHSDFKITPFADAWRSALPSEPPLSADGSSDTLLLTPAMHGTDGFFIAVLGRAS